MQPITINQQYLTHNAQYITCQQSKACHVRLMCTTCIRACLAQSYAPQNLWLVYLQEPPARPSPILE
jgi:hypothetical protein